MASELSNEEMRLLSMLREGDRDAFTQIYQKYFSMLYALSYRYLQDKEMAEDVIQQVFMRLWESHSTLCISVCLKNYLYTMTKNSLLNMIRDKNDKIVHRYEMLQQQDVVDEGMSEKMEEERKINHFYKAISKLSSVKRAICLLKMQGELNNQEIADKLNMPVGTVKNYYTQALQLLKYYLRQYNYE